MKNIQLMKAMANKPFILTLYFYFKLNKYTTILILIIKIKSYLYITLTKCESLNFSIKNQHEQGNQSHRKYPNERFIPILPAHHPRDQSIRSI
jgi:hypothetical protein